MNEGIIILERDQIKKGDKIVTGLKILTVEKVLKTKLKCSTLSGTKVDILFKKKVTLLKYTPEAEELARQRAIVEDIRNELSARLRTIRRLPINKRSDLVKAGQLMSNYLDELTDYREACRKVEKILV